MKSISPFVKRLRHKQWFADARRADRRHLKKLNKERAELLGPAVAHADTKARVEWLNAKLALAVKRNDCEEIERLTPLCLEAREELKASHFGLSS